MGTAERVVVMMFGAIIALIGLWLFAKKQGQENAPNSLKFAKFEVSLSAPSLVIFMVGMAMVVFPFLLGGSITTDDPQPSSQAASALPAGRDDRPPSVIVSAASPLPALAPVAAPVVVPTPVIPVAALPQRSPVGAPFPSGSAGFQIGGQWRDDENSVATFVQTGNQVRLEVRDASQQVVIMSGLGMIVGNVVTVAYQSVLNTSGRIVLTIVDAQHLVGQMQDSASGITEITLTR